MSEFVVNRREQHAYSNLSVKDAWLPAALCVLFAALVMTVSGGFNTGDWGLLHRLTLWLIIGGLIVGQVFGLSWLLRRFVSYVSNHALFSDVIALLMTVPLVTLQTHWLKFTPLLPKSVDPPLEFLLFMTPIIATVGGLFLVLSRLLRVALAEHCEVESTESQSVNAGGQSSRLGALPATLLPAHADEINRVSIDDHYLSIFTARERFLIRGRMSDILKLLESGRPGIHVHRSHWVAADQICRLERRGRDFDIILIDGENIPVSRARLAQVKELIASR